MFIARVKRRSRWGFTLLEITLAIGILAMMSLAIYRFVQTNLTALRISADTNRIDAQYSGFANLLNAQFAALPPGKGTLLGEPFKQNERSRDEISWICSAGPGLLTRHAVGEYRVSMRLRPMSKESDRMEIGVMRTAFDETGTGSDTGSWVPLLQDAQSLQIRYFDPRLNVWVEKWTDTIVLPRLVKFSIGRGGPVPWETIVALARTPL